MKTILEKLLKITEEIPPLTKDGTNQAGGYSYITEQDVLKAVKPLLIKHKVILLSDIESSSILDSVSSVKMVFRFQCTETLEMCEFNWGGTGYDKQDKGLYKAITGALKYFLIKTLLIETGENTDPEFDGKKPLLKQVNQSQMTDEEMDKITAAREARAEEVRKKEKEMDADQIPGLENIKVTPLKAKKN